MFGQNSILNTTDFDRVLEILALVGDPVQTKSKVTHARALAEAFETLAKHQTELAREREAHAAQVAAKAKELEAREDNIVRREDALKTAEARTANLENDLHRRLKILKNAAA